LLRQILDTRRRLLLNDLLAVLVNQAPPVPLFITDPCERVLVFLEKEVQELKPGQTAILSAPGCLDTLLKVLSALNGQSAKELLVFAELLDKFRFSNVRPALELLVLGVAVQFDCVKHPFEQVERHFVLTRNS
jgi:hypothetical protein